MGRLKRVGIFADLHCGHFAGLTHPNWFVSAGTERGKGIRVMQQDAWRSFRRLLKKTGPFDIAIWNGDLIDGRGERSGGTELVTTDRVEQCDMASRVVQITGAKTNIFTRGTPYHTGHLEDWENMIANECNGVIGDHKFVDVNGLILDVKHKVAGSSIPHGRFTSAAKDRFWNLVWADREDGQPRADVIIRSHVHYHIFCGDFDWLALTTPALQLAATKFGARQCSGTVDWGFITFDVKNKENWTWLAHRVRQAAVKVKLEVV